MTTYIRRHSRACLALLFTLAMLYDFLLRPVHRASRLLSNPTTSPLLTKALKNLSLKAFLVPHGLINPYVQLGMLIWIQKRTKQIVPIRRLCSEERDVAFDLFQVGNAVNGVIHGRSNGKDGMDFDGKLDEMNGKSNERNGKLNEMDTNGKSNERNGKSNERNGKSNGMDSNGKSNELYSNGRSNGRDGMANGIDNVKLNGRIGVDNGNANGMADGNANGIADENPNGRSTDRDGNTNGKSNGINGMATGTANGNANENFRQCIIVYLPGITGANIEAMPFVHEVLKKGYMCAVYHRRGHGQRELKEPSFNIFGNSLDLWHGLKMLKNEFPGRPIALVGNSAGTATLVRYLGDYGHAAQVQAAVCISAGYDIVGVWKRAEFKGSLLDKYLTKGLKEFFLSKNLPMLEARNKEAVEMMLKAESVHEFSLYAALFGHPEHNWSHDQWLEQTCPLRVVNNIRVPLLAINSMDDPICHGQFVEKHAMGLQYENPNLALVVTDNGSHCAHLSFQNGITGGLTNWGHQLALEFIEGITGEE